MRRTGIERAGFLTELAAEAAHPIPYPPFSVAELQVFERFARYAWKATVPLFNQHEIDFATSDEEEISFAVAVVVDLLTSKRSEEFSWFLDVFQYEGQAANRANFSRDSIRQQCDFAFRRTAIVSGRIRTLDCLFAEAKIVSPKHTMGYYSNTGIKRYIDGSYAHAMPQAVLFGYVRDTDQTLPKALVDHFKRDAGRKAIELEVIDGPKPFPKSRVGAIRMHVTSHERRGPNAGHRSGPGPVELFHLWLHVVSDR